MQKTLATFNPTDNEPSSMSSSSLAFAHPQTSQQTKTESSTTTSVSNTSSSTSISDSTTASSSLTTTIPKVMGAKMKQK
jgi:hypothetical protein